MTPPPALSRGLGPAMVFLLAALLAGLTGAGPHSARAGTLVNARCPCGYHRERLPLFGGRANFRTVCRFPALCATSHELVLINLLDPLADTAHCQGTKAIPYTDPSLAPKVPGAVVASWNLRDQGMTVQLYAGAYRCPHCGRKTLRFSFAGNWD